MATSLGHSGSSRLLSKSRLKNDTQAARKHSSPLNKKKVKICTDQSDKFANAIKSN
jgi:hypothetical protein